METKPHNPEIAVLAVVFHITKWAIKIGWFVGKRLAVSLAWLLAFVLVAYTGSDAVAIAFALIVIGTVIAGFWYPVAWKFAPVIADWKRAVVWVKGIKAKKRGNEFLAQIGLVPPEEAQQGFYEAYLMETPEMVEFHLDIPIRGVSTAEMVKRINEFADQLNAHRVSHEDRENGAITVRLWIRDPLDEPFVLEEPAELDPETMTVGCAIGETGELANLCFKGNAGMLVAGMPGSGKTAGVTSFLLPLALSDDVKLSVIDCKGGADWENYSPVSTEYLSDSDTVEGLTAIRDTINALKVEMVERISKQKAELGNSNFWNNPIETRRQQSYPFRLLVIDECQELFISTTDKEKKALLAEIGTALTSITKRGRSAGICVIYITQKPTADSIPTGIRDNCALRIAFRLSTAQAEEAVLGATGDQPRPRATDIPANRPGGAIIGTETGAYEAVRFGYMPEAEQERFLTKTKGIPAGTAQNPLVIPQPQV